MKAIRPQTVTFTQPQYDWLRSEAERLGITVSDLLLRIVDERRERKRRAEVRHDHGETE